MQSIQFVVRSCEVLIAYSAALNVPPNFHCAWSGTIMQAQEDTWTVFPLPR